MVSRKSTTEVRGREEFPRIIEKKISSTLGGELSGRQDYYPNEVASDEERTSVDCRSSDDCERTRFEEENQHGIINYDHIEVNPKNYRDYKISDDDIERTSPEELQRDERIDIERTFEVLQNNDINKPEVAGYQAYLQGQEKKQRKETLRRKALNTDDGPSKRRKNQDPRQDSKVVENSRIIALYELGKNRVMVNRELATMKPKEQAQERKNRKEKLRRKATYTEGGSSKRRKNQDPRQHSEVATHNRIIALYELGKNRVMVNRELATTKPKESVDIANIELAENSRIIALYELGKNRLTVNRELAATKLKDYTVIVNAESIRPSERISALYELGKSRVMANRELAATKLLTPDNGVAYALTLSGTKVSVSEIAGRRLYIQAQISAERKNRLRQIARATPPPQMKLATQQGSHKKSIEWGTTPLEHYFALYEQGKNRVAADRELEIKCSENKAGLSKEEVHPGYASIRQMEQYEMGKQRLVNERMNEKQHTDNIHDVNLSPQFLTTIVANATMIKLYEMSKKMQENRKEYREENGEEDANMDIHLTSHSSKEITPNATMLKLYAMSRQMQAHGKERRKEIIHARVDFPIIKV